MTGERGAERAAAGPGVRHVAVGFARALRTAGLAIGVADSEALVAALGHIDPVVRRELYLAARATLVRRREDIAVFDAVFATWFGGPAPAARRRRARRARTRAMTPAARSTPRWCRTCPSAPIRTRGQIRRPRGRPRRERARAPGAPRLRRGDARRARPDRARDARRSGSPSRCGDRGGGSARAGAAGSTCRASCATRPAGAARCSARRAGAPSCAAVR